MVPDLAGPGQPQHRPGFRRSLSQCVALLRAALSQDGFALPRRASQRKSSCPSANAEDGLNAAERALKKSGWPVERIADRNEPSLYSERHRFSVMAVYIVHASLLLIFAGGIIDGVFGYSGFMALQTGQTSNVIELRTGGTKQIPFAREVQRRGTGELRRRLAQALVVEAGGRAERPGSRSEGDRRQRSPGASAACASIRRASDSTGKLNGLKVAVDSSGNARQRLARDDAAHEPAGTARRATPRSRWPSTFPTSSFATTRSSSAPTIR